MPRTSPVCRLNVHPASEGQCSVGTETKLLDNLDRAMRRRILAYRTGWTGRGPSSPGATTWTPRRHSSGRAKSHSTTPLWSRAVDRAEDLPGVQINDDGHPGLEAFPCLGFGSWKNRMERNRCSLMPSIRGRSLSTSGSLVAAMVRARWTSHHKTRAQSRSRGGPAGINDSGDQHVSQPAGGAGQTRDLDGGFEEGHARAC